MATMTAAVSLGEYLNTAYDPDREFVNGVLVERNVGTLPHSLLQTIVVLYFGRFRKSHQIEVCTEARLLVSPERHRIPDVLILDKPYRRGRLVTDIPAVTVEIKSPEDTFDDIFDKCFEYEALGVRNIVVMDPRQPPRVDIRAEQPPPSEWRFRRVAPLACDAGFPVRRDVCGIVRTVARVAGERPVLVQ